MQSFQFNATLQIFVNFQSQVFQLNCFHKKNHQRSRMWFTRLTENIEKGVATIAQNVNKCGNTCLLKSVRKASNIFAQLYGNSFQFFYVNFSTHLKR